MPHISEMRESKFLRKTDLPVINNTHQQVFTIRSVEQFNVAPEGQESQERWCAVFEGEEKPMVLNQTNLNVLAAVCGNEYTENWVGHQIVVFYDPTVQYKGKTTGGLRMRAPRNSAAPAPARTTAAPPPRPAPASPPPPAPAPAPAVEEDDVPF